MTTGTRHLPERDSRVHVEAPYKLKGPSYPVNRQLLLAIACLCTILFVGALSIAVSGQYAGNDAALGDAVRAAVNQYGLAQSVAFMSRVSDHPERPVLLLTGLLAFVFVRLHRYWSAALILCGIAGGSLLELTIRSAVDRPPPHIYGEHSFPSGHAMLAVSFFGVLAFLSWHLTQRRGVALLTGLTVVLLSTLVGIERLAGHHLGVHYPSDVLGGYALGGMWLMITLTIFARRLQEERCERQSGWEPSRLPRDGIDDSQNDGFRC